MKIETCRFCGQEFNSVYGKKYCSNECKIEATKRFWAENNKNRKTGNTNILYTKICPICNSQFDGRSVQKYCSKNCSKIAKRKQSKEYFPEWYQENRESVIKKTIERKNKSKGE